MIDVELLAEALWDAREITDPSGERIGVTDDDHTRAAVYWQQVLEDGLWPASVAAQRREAQLVLDILATRTATR